MEGTPAPAPGAFPEPEGSAPEPEPQPEPGGSAPEPAEHGELRSA